MSSEAESQKEEAKPTPPLSLPLRETLDLKIAFYSGDRYSHTIGITSEFLKDEAYSRSAMHDAMYEYLMEKSQEFRERFEATKVPELDLDEIEEELTWMSYKTKAKAERGEAAWMKSSKVFTDIDNPTANKLVELVEKAGGKLELGGYVFQFSGEGNRFISRRPLKKERTK